MEGGGRKGESTWGKGSYLYLQQQFRPLQNARDQGRCLSNNHFISSQWERD